MSCWHFPGLLLAIALVAVLGPSLTNVVLALSLIGWVGYARGSCARQVLRAREFEFVSGGESALGPPRRAFSRSTIIPTALPAVTVQATLGMGGAILAEAALSFLGLGVQPPTPSWGTMLNGGRTHLLDAPHLTIFPGLAIAFLVLGFNFLGMDCGTRSIIRSLTDAASACTGCKGRSQVGLAVLVHPRREIRDVTGPAASSGRASSIRLRYLTSASRAQLKR